MIPVPRVSVIIPAYYSHGTLEACLKALEAQTFRFFETIVVNSSPEEQTGEIVRHFPEVIFSQSATRLLPHGARNQGVNLARGELLVFTDPDCMPRSDWLACLVEAQEAGHAVVGGSVELASKRWLECGVHLCKFFWLLSGLTPGPRWILPTVNVCYGREVWEKVGPFDGDRFCGDALLSWRARVRGYQPWFEPRAIVEHQHGGRLFSFWRERLGRGREFAEVRTAFECWSGWRAAAYLVTWPMLLALVLARAGRDAFKSGCGWTFVLTLPVQLLGHLAWSLGEARIYWRLVVHGSVGGTSVR